MKTTSISVPYSSLSHSSGLSCWRAARWCEGKCKRATRDRCQIWKAGDCTATSRRDRRITIVVTDTDYQQAVELLRTTGYEVK